MILNVVGCGRVGRTLGRLWSDAGVFAIGNVMNESIASAATAVAFVGAGTPTARIADLRPADAFLIAVPDDRIEAMAARLAEADVVRPGDVVFHCSGSLSAEAALGAVRFRGARIASAHPIHSFADPDRSRTRFAGTFCGIEGDPSALPVLRNAFEAIGARVFAVDGANKLVYHAATVMASNYLVTLLDASLRCLRHAGVDEETGRALLEPLVRGTAENVFAQGTTRALTGPIARGDARLVERQADALAAWDAPIADLYRRLGRSTVPIARARSGGPDDDDAALDRIESILTTESESDHG